MQYFSEVPRHQFLSDSLHLFDSARCSPQLLRWLQGKYGSPSSRLIPLGFPPPDSGSLHCHGSFLMPLSRRFVVFYLVLFCPAFLVVLSGKDGLNYCVCCCLLLTEIEPPGIFKSHMNFVYSVIQNACCSLVLESMQEKLE